MKNRDCQTCYGSGLIAVGPWGSRPARVQCPDCAAQPDARGVIA